MRQGRIVTFYSYKGGVGRTMALANIGALLARRGRRVLVVDWDLEAAGLHPYFAGRLPEGWTGGRGLLDLVEDAALEWTTCVAPVALEGLREGAGLDLLASGSGAEDYVPRLQRIDWAALYAAQELGGRIETWRRQWADVYDFVLIDSRTGLSDIGGICTIQLPDMLVMLFAANDQSLTGTLDVARRAVAGREQLAVTRADLLVLPVPSRFEGRTEVDQARKWLERFATELVPLYTNWLDAGVRPEEILRHTRIPAVPRWSFGESLPVLVEDTRDPDTISYAFEALAALIDKGLEGTEELVKAQEQYVAAPKVPERVDFGLVAWGGVNPYVRDVAAELQRRGKTTFFYWDVGTPGDDIEAVYDTFVAISDVVVGFIGGVASATPFSMRCRAGGKRFVPVHVTGAGKAFGIDGLVAIGPRLSVEECARELILAAARPLRRRNDT